MGSNREDGTLTKTGKTSHTNLKEKDLIHNKDSDYGEEKGPV